MQKTFEQQPDDVKELLRVLYRTRAVAPHPVAANPGVPSGVRERVRNAFLQLGHSEEGRKLLARIPIEKIGIASMADYASLADLDTSGMFECH